MLSAISDTANTGALQQRLIARGHQLSEDISRLSPDTIRSILMMLVQRIDITPEHVEIRVYRNGLHDLLAPKSTQPTLAAPTLRNHDGDVLRLTVEARLQRCGREMKLIVDNAENQAEADPGLLRIIVRVHDFHERLIRNPDLTVPAIAGQEQLTIGYLSRLLRLSSLAPDIVTAIINGQHPPQLSAKRLMRLAFKLPTDWAEQRKLLGFQRV
jgi:site-specific DNA recombinase